MEQIAENIYLEEGYDDINVGAIVTRQGVIAIDTPSYPRQARDWAIRLQSLSLKSIIFVILTDYHGDRVFNARWFNAPIITHQVTANKLIGYDKRFPTPIIDSLTQRNPQRSREFSNSLVEKAAISFNQKMQISKGHVSIELLEAPGPTSGNIWVHLPEQKVLFAGDTVTHDHHPFFLEGTSTLWIKTLERLQMSFNHEYTIVPGRGAISPLQTVVSPLKAYIQLLQDRVREHLLNGRSRESTAVYIPELLKFFPHHNYPPDWMRQQIKMSLDQIYDELQRAMINQKIASHG